MSNIAAMVRIPYKGLDAATMASTQIYTTLNGTQRFYPTDIVIAGKTVTTFVAVATLSIGTNSATYNNILTAQALTGVTAANKMLRFSLALTAIDSIPPNTAIFANVSVAALAAAYTVDVYVVGYYD